MTQESNPFRRSFVPFRGRFDPCPPLGKRTFVTPPNLFIGFQPPDFPQFSPIEALKKGTLWKPFYDFYESPYKK
ncbi:spore coat associated protein CotJA [Jeotgalibacillus sp. S-D1]|uniref:spore coat associated protein CotJA n=1 Tax=Jeotgalibacillus sp. S-D1 TaxID=2552189 RepID=UPI00105A957D|nr:spore coat associated protein CotJA [Jeotgalibacillus sp. S-D1]TDL31330.1 spore coat associated protein CotJA [Jeotgalibacillus sp. S-D1]